MKYSMFIGRWQPWHNGHRWLIDQRLNEGKNVLICVREVSQDDKNPYDPIDVKKGFETDDEEAQKRFISVTLKKGKNKIHILNGYFPQGEEREHPIKFPYKVKFYKDLIKFVSEDVYRNIKGEIKNVKSQYLSIRDKYGTDPAKNEIGEWDKPTISSRLSIASQGLSTFYGPTGMNKYNLEIARELVDEYKNDIESINTIIEDIEEKIKALNHPHISGSGIN